MNDFDPASFDPRARQTPLAPLARARAAEQSTFLMDDYQMWCVTRYEDVVEALSNHRVFSSAKMVRKWPPPPETASELPFGHPLENAPVTTDPPRHTNIRRLAQKAFTPKLVAAREPEIHALVEAVADKFVSRGAIDLIPDYCAEIPPTVVTQLLGVSASESAAFRAWALEAHHLSFSPPTLSDEELLRLSREMVNFDRFLRLQINERRESPRDDLISYFVHATGDEGEPQLTDPELIGVIASMVTAGSDTTSTLIGHAIYVLLTQPEIRRDVEADRGLVANLIEETLRYYPSARAMRRTTKCPVQIGGADVPEDATMFVHLASANRDERVFPDPDLFDVHRPNSKRHTSLGAGGHICLGAPLARLEAVVAVIPCSTRFPRCAWPREKFYAMSRTTEICSSRRWCRSESNVTTKKAEGAS